MYTRTGVSVKFLMVWETNSMVGYHLMAEDHSINSVWGLGGDVSLPAGAGQCLDESSDFFEKVFEYRP